MSAPEDEAADDAAPEDGSKLADRDIDQIKAMFDKAIAQALELGSLMASLKERWEERGGDE